MGIGGHHLKRILAGEGDESADSAKGSPRSLSERLTHARTVKRLCNVEVNMSLRQRLRLLLNKPIY